MQQVFPPDLRAYADPDADVPDTRSAGRLLWWLIRRQGWLAPAGLLVSTIWMFPMAVGPWIVGRAIDEGIVAGDSQATTRWLVLLLAVTVVGALSGIVYHSIVVAEWLVALHGTSRLVTNKALQLGHVLARRTPTGEVLSVSSGDGDQFGMLMEITTRAFSQLLAYLVVAAIVLSMSVRLGLVVLLVAPLLVLVAMPVLRPMAHWQGIERSRSSELTSRATDIVAGLRILRGIGGEETFGEGYAAQSRAVRDAGIRAGAWQAGVDALGVLMSGGFLVVLMWSGVRQVAVGELTVGQLVTFLGYGLFLVGPVQTFFEAAQKWTRTMVSARKAVAVLDQEPPWRPDAEATGHLPDGPADLTDERTGLVIRPGLLTMVVSATPDDSAALADRLGRYLPGDPDTQVSLDLGEDVKGRARRVEQRRRVVARRAQAAADRERARQPWGVTLGGTDLGSVPLGEVRERILVSDTGSQVFAGTLQEAIDPRGRLTRSQAEQALHTAAAEDVYDAVPGGWQGVLDERGRGLSGGQRQRLVLARALAADPDVLVLVEPTSAVDAHTEARIADRLAAHRRGRTTVVMTASPLLLHHADEVALLAGDRVIAQGRHDDLLAHDADYRAVVVRGEDR
ncbi:ABC transporter transmembrane domain-containing protein [Arsenicicoccus dermatophilus]|uniref:ABC transporter transmembrane domain-containing protein n=1 Tax=Arsenicicoccus dermatophilus TaxID=1076331 RepID=UPI003916F967